MSAASRARVGPGVIFLHGAWCSESQIRQEIEVASWLLYAPSQMNTRHYIAMGGCAAMLLGAVACGVTETIDNHTDCHDICNRYKDCFDDNYDVDSCEDRCEDHAKDSQSFENDVDGCASCISDESCSSHMFGCDTECTTVVP